uniref:Reverse transcriptase domain-containing protein n=1 Tax=Amaranthus palmeri TaxID=107608 RepID=A0A6C0T5G6_AMAPA|nr:hypothetical protein AP_R.00g000480-v1.0.a3 [Amaranthus palmeri]
MTNKTSLIMRLFHKACVTTVSFSILVNGTPLKPFDAKKGLRQGDPISPYLFAIAMDYLSRLMQKQNNFSFHPRCKATRITHLLFADDLLMFCRADISSVQSMMRSFQIFSRASGLEANNSKSNVYISGVDDQCKMTILSYLQMEEGSFPFRYLGVPLHSKKLNSRDCRPLVDKIVGRIGYWSSKLLSYAGRIQLVRSVIRGIQNFWAQIFCIPKKVLKMVENICRSFIWTGKEGLSRKAAISWLQMGLPYSKGGLNLRDMYQWNRVAILKHLWNIAVKKDNLWVKWVHSYYVKDRNLNEVRPSIHASWSFKKIIKQWELVERLGGWNSIVSGGVFCIGKVYDRLIANHPKVDWGPIMIKNVASPSARFITWLAIQNRLATRDRLAKWLELTDDRCVLCNNASESAHHLFFDCRNAKEIRAKIFNFLSWNLNEANFHDEIQCMSKLNKKKTDRAKLIVGLWTEMIYNIWMQRNRKIFDNHSFNQKEVIDCIVFRIAGRVNSRMNDMLVSR